jgi:hypothetical protein
MDSIILDVSLISFVALVISLMIAPERRSAVSMTKVAASAS